MALKTLMIKAKIDSKNEELEELQAKDESFAARETELADSILEAQTAEERATVEAAVDAFDAENEAHEAAKAALSADISALQTELQKLESVTPPAPAPAAAEHDKERMNTSMPTKSLDIRALPMSQRVFDALPKAQRESIVAQSDVQAFLAQVRNLCRTQASVTGAELTIPVIFLDLISENRFRYSKLLRHIRVRNVGGQARQTIGGTVPEAIWTECCGALNELSFTFNQITLDCYKLGGFVLLCNSLLNDNDLELAAELIEMISEALGKAKDKAIIYGKGAAYKMPLGIVTRLAQTVQPDNWPANGPAWVDLHTSNIIKIDGTTLNGAAFWGALRIAAGKTYTEYSRGDTFWAMNSNTYAFLESKAIATTATGEWVALIGGRLPIISGDIEILEFMPDYDIVGGYGDLYLYGQRQGIELGTDVNGFTLRVRDNTLVWGKERGDGQPIIGGAFVAINIHNTDVVTDVQFAGDAANTVSGILLNTGAATVAGTGKVQLQAILLPFGVKGDVTWSSATTSKATVNSDGVVTGVSAGTSVITASCNGYAAQCTVTVT